MSDSGPAGWQEKPLLDVVDLPRGQVLPTAEPFRSQVLIAPDHIESRTGRVLSLETAVSQGAISGKYQIEPGDVLLSKIRPALRKVAYSSVHGLCSADIYPLRARAEIDPKFLLAVLLGSRFGQFAESLSGRSGIPKINRKELAEFRVALPPPREQRRIAEILESADEAIRSTERLTAKLRMAGQALLKDLIDRFDDSSYPPSSVDQEFDIKAGITLGPHRQPRMRPVQYLRVANVQRGFIDYKDVALLEASPGDALTYTLRAGDLLVVEGHASPSEIGRCALVRDDHGPLFFQNHLFRLRSRRLNAEYALLWLNSTYVRSYWRRTCATSSGLYTINSRQLRALPVPTPDPSDQERVVRIARAHETAVRKELDRMEKLQRLRLGLMEDMLAGRVRVNGEESAAT
ncbi:restriction endonuclease subunit S [Micromonospora aurantiaca]|uniref:restriction endonuclease subunit S n=1 Tax=Micromonospora aurantiaca (nom. illeg.) TaxID=47850 RepID=UPI0034567CCE